MKQEMMQYKGYHGSVEYSLESDILHGSIQFINDLVTYEAENLPQLKQEFEAAVDDYLETCRELGKEPDKEFSGTFNVRVGPEVHRKSAIAARLEGITLNEFARRALEHATQDGDEIVHRHKHEHFFSITTKTETPLKEPELWQEPKISLVS